MEKPKKSPLDRRDFLKGAAVGAAALVAESPAANAQQAEPVRAAAAIPSARAAAAETEIVPSADVLTSGRPAADYMVDVLKSLGFEYICSNPGSSFRGLQESFINHGGNRSPEWITCLHEEQSVAIADGYAQIEGKPLLVMAHGTVGIQHAAMAIYNSFCSRIPVYIIAGNSLDATERRPGVEWVHSVQDAAAMVRDYIKWDDTPVSLPHFAESAVRAYKIAMSRPMAPVMLVADSALQETAVPEGTDFRIPRLTVPAPPQGDSGAVSEVARLLVEAENPVVIAGDLIHSQEGMDLLVELAETLQARVQGGRNMPSRHPLNQRGGLGNADVILGLEVWDLWGALNSMRDQLHRTVRSNIRADAKIASISTKDLYVKSNYQGFQRYPEVDIAIAADAEATLPFLNRGLQAFDQRGSPAGGSMSRGRALAASKAQTLERVRPERGLRMECQARSATPACLAELWGLIKDKDWASAGAESPLWDVTKHYQTLGGGRAYGVGYHAPAAVGAALAHRKYGRLVVSRQNDGDLMYVPGTLWTAAHHRIPFLSVMRNNRSYHQEVMHLQRMANRYQRGATAASTSIGTKIDDPNIDYATLARSMGVYGEGPITNPNDLRPALERAIERVENGEVALVDVVSQPR